MTGALPEVLLSEGLISENQYLQSAEDASMAATHQTVELLKLGSISEQKLVSFLAKKYSVYPQMNIPDNLLNGILSEEKMDRYLCLPLSLEEHQLVVGVLDPTQLYEISRLPELKNYLVKPILITFSQFKKLRSTHNIQENNSQGASGFQVSPPLFRSSQLLNKNLAKGNELVEKILIKIFNDAMARQVSQISFESYREYLRVSFLEDSRWIIHSQIGLDAMDGIEKYLKTQLDTKQETQFGRKLKIGNNEFLVDLKFIEGHFGKCAFLKLRKQLDSSIQLETTLFKHQENEYRYIINTLKKVSGFLLIESLQEEAGAFLFQLVLRKRLKFYGSTETKTIVVWNYSDGTIKNILETQRVDKDTLSFFYPFTTLAIESQNLMDLVTIEDLTKYPNKGGFVILHSEVTSSQNQVKRNIFRMKIDWASRLCPQCRVANSLSPAEASQLGFSGKEFNTLHIYSEVGCRFCIKGRKVLFLECFDVNGTLINDSITTQIKRALNSGLISLSEFKNIQSRQKGARENGN